MDTTAISLNVDMVSVCQYFEQRKQQIRLKVAMVTIIL